MKISLLFTLSDRRREKDDRRNWFLWEKFAERERKSSQVCADERMRASLYRNVNFSFALSIRYWFLTLENSGLERASENREERERESDLNSHQDQLLFL